MTALRTVRLLDFEAVPDAGLLDWLSGTNNTLIVSHSNKLISCGLDERGQAIIDHAMFDRVTGVCTQGDDGLYVAAHHELWLLTDAVSPGDLSPTGKDRWMMCRTARFLGGVRPADPIAVEEDCWFVSVTLSAVCSLHDTLSACVRWLPKFISAARPELRCRLTGLGAIEGVPRVVTSVSMSDEPGGWEQHRAHGGVLIDITNDEVLASGLSMPHSPRWHNGAWWLVQAGTGELGYVERGAFTAVARIDGFARGLAISDGVGIIGGSGSRWDELVDGLAVGERLRGSGRRPDMGAFLFDLSTGNRVGELRLDGTAREIADIVVLPGTRSVELSSPRGTVAQDWTTYPADADLTWG